MSFICAVQRACRLYRLGAAGEGWARVAAKVGIAPAWLGPAWRGAGGCGRMSRSQRRRGRGALCERGASVCTESEGQERLDREQVCALVAVMVCAGLW
eukprot:scaffold141187_cov145-Phaeocystis_antarctica.AAC.1